MDPRLGGYFYFRILIFETSVFTKHFGMSGFDVRVWELVCYCFIFIVGLLGNLTICLVVLKSGPSYTLLPFNVYLMTLAIASIGCCLSTSLCHVDISVFTSRRNWRSYTLQNYNWLLAAVLAWRGINLSLGYNQFWEVYCNFQAVRSIHSDYFQENSPSDRWGVVNWLHHSAANRYWNRFH